MRGVRILRGVRGNRRFVVFPLALMFLVSICKKLRTERSDATKGYY